MYYALQLNFDGSTVAIAASETPESVPSGQVPCDAEQYLNFKQFTIVAGEIAPIGSQALLAQAKTLQVKVINAAAQSTLHQMVASYPALEVSTWPQQLVEATAYIDDPKSDTPLLSASAAISGQKVADLAAAVIEKSAVYMATSGAIIGKRSLLTNQIATAKTIADVLAVVW